MVLLNVGTSESVVRDHSVMTQSEDSTARNAILKKLFAENLRVVDLETRIQAHEARTDSGGFADLSTLVALNAKLSAAQRNCELLQLELLATNCPAIYKM